MNLKEISQLGIDNMGGDIKSKIDNLSHLCNDLGAIATDSVSKPRVFNYDYEQVVITPTVSTASASKPEVIDYALEIAAKGCIKS